MAEDEVLTGVRAAWGRLASAQPQEPEPPRCLADLMVQHAPDMQTAMFWEMMLQSFGTQLDLDEGTVSFPHPIGPELSRIADALEALVGVFCPEEESK